MAQDSGEECQVVTDTLGRSRLGSHATSHSNIDRVVALLNSHDESERKRAIETLIPLGFLLFRALRKAFADGPNTPQFQEDLCCLYREIRKRLNTTDLIESLSDKDPEIRVDAVRALRIKSLHGAGLTPEIIRAYIRTLRDSHPQVREEAARNLSWASPDVEAHGALVQALRDIDPSVQRQAKLSLNSFRLEAAAAAGQSTAFHGAPRFSPTLDWFMGIVNTRVHR
jgi:HEAT repeat protein